jgi:hypothetical protein
VPGAVRSGPVERSDRRFAGAEQPVVGGERFIGMIPQR